MAYYDKIASKWNKITGYKGGTFKELILNDHVISKVTDIDTKVILEIGIGNGYFMPLLLRKRSGQVPECIYLTDLSGKNIEIAKKQFRVKNATYQKLDVYKKFNYPDNSIDIIISNMVFNELKGKGVENGFSEIKRVLKPQGKFVISALHPQFIDVQIQRGVVKNDLMTSKNGIKIPAIKRSVDKYLELLDDLEFEYSIEDIYGNKKLFNMKPKLKEIAEIPIAILLFGECKK